MLIYFEDTQFASLVCWTLGNSYRYEKLYDNSFKDLIEGVQYALKLSQGDILSHAYSELGRIFAECGEWDSDRYYFECSLANAKLLRDLEIEAMALGDLSVVFLFLGDYVYVLLC